MEAFSARPHRRVQPLLCQPLRARCAGAIPGALPHGSTRGSAPLRGLLLREAHTVAEDVLEGTRLPSEGGPGRLECCEGGGVTGRCPAAPHRDPPKGFVQDVAPSPTSSW